MLVTIIFRNSAAKMQRLNYFTVIIIRDQSEVAYLSDNLFNRNLAPEGNDHNPNFIKFQLKRACKVIELRSLLEMENVSHRTYLYICITTGWLEPSNYIYMLIIDYKCIILINEAVSLICPKILVKLVTC